MKSTLKRFLSLVLCMCMVLTLLPNVTITAFAAESGEVCQRHDSHGLNPEFKWLRYNALQFDPYNYQQTQYCCDVEL